MTEEVKFTDIYVDEDITSEVAEITRSTRYVKGSELEAFEEEFAAYCGTDHAVGVSNGTAALLLAMKALDIGPGDEVFVPAHTYFATVSPVLEVGATPVFVDIDPQRYTMDPDDLATKVVTADNPTAVGVTHMHGQPADMDSILDVAAEYDLLVIEDAAQAHGAEYCDQKAGTFGDAGCFSFYPSKNMTVGGDGGMIVTDDDALARRARMLRNHGRDEDGVHRVLGLNYRLDEINAVVGRKQLNLLDEWNEGRRTAARLYDDLLADIDEVTTPAVADNATHVYHHYPVQVPERETFRATMDDAGVQTGIHYETPAHRQPAVKKRVGARSTATGGSTV